MQFPRPSEPPMTQSTGPFKLPPLPWEENALEPVVSARTISFHYGKHHAAYVKKTNELVAGTRFESMPLERIVVEAAGQQDTQKLFNQAAQVWNHTFFWSCLKPGGGGKPSGDLLRRIEADLRGFDRFRED